MFKLEETDLPLHKIEAFHRLVSKSGDLVYVLARNKYAERVAQAVRVEAFIDDFTADRTFLGRPIIRMTDLPSDCIVVSCVVAGNCISVMDKLQATGALRTVDYFTLARLAPELFPPVDFCSGNREDILKNLVEYEKIYNLLSDETSKTHFKQVCQFRLTMDLEYLRGFKLAIDRQYFENFLPRNEADVFVDGGGYDGHTSLGFAAWNSTYSRIHYFEPTPVMMEMSRQNLAALRDVRFFQKGLFSRHERLRFEADAGAANSLCANGQTEIEVVRLDDEIQTPITFMKLDIEGAEHDALLGAAEHIRLGTPTMAICIYHDQRDFWRIPNRVLEINNRYKLYVRHYTQGVHETVMFFVPVPVASGKAHSAPL